MGLDMYLKGRKFNWNDPLTPDRIVTEDGFEVGEITLDLGYWRKHPDLHGYIIQEFANGVDECQRIDLDLAALRSIVQAIQEKRLPKTSGFFFGESDESRDSESIDILSKAITWLATEDTGAMRSVYYLASW